MKFPNAPTCHPNYGKTFEWRNPMPVTRGPGTHMSHHVQTCSYCGSIHPEALLKLLAGGARLEEADRKYGFVHKFYVHASNPDAGKQVQIGTKNVGSSYEELEYGPAGDLWGKFYTVHLNDEGYDDEAKAALFAALTKHSCYEWGQDEKGVYHRGTPTVFVVENKPDAL